MNLPLDYRLNRITKQGMHVSNNNGLYKNYMNKTVLEGSSNEVQLCCTACMTGTAHTHTLSYTVSQQQVTQLSQRDRAAGWVLKLDATHAVILGSLESP